VFVHEGKGAAATAAHQSDTVSARPPAVLVPHDRSSVHRSQRPRSRGASRVVLLLAIVGLVDGSPLTPRRARAQVRDTVARTADPGPSPQDSLPWPRVIEGLRFRADTALRLRRPARFGVFGGLAERRPTPAAVASRVDRTTRSAAARRVDDAWRADLLRAVAAPVVAVADSGPTPGALVPLLPAAPRGADARGAFAGDLMDELSDYGMSLTARLESKVQRNRNERCTAAQLTIIGNNCFGTFQPAFDFQFNVRTGGVVAQRVFVNVDYDSQREFDASNNISVYYQGKTDELLQRLEVGNVSLEAPPSRFLTSGIPSGNYGVQATGQLGPMRFRSIVAQQKGNVSKDNVFTVGQTTLQQVDRVIEDIQVEPRRFFFTVDPRQFAGYPNIDILNRSQMQQLAASLPDSVRPVRVYLYRQLIGATNQNPRGPQFSVRGARNPSRQIYELLRENVDYYLDPSQLWIALVRPLSPNNERLVVAYEVNVGGAPGRNPNTGGTPDLEFTAAQQFANLLWEPELQPTNPAYFLREIKSVYRLGGEDVQRASIALKLVTGTSGDQEKPIDVSRGETYLQLYGLSQATNPAAFDVENRLWPRPNDPNVVASGTGLQKLIRDYFVVFPSVQPFARAGLAQPAANPANDTLYLYPNEYLYSAQRPQAIYRLVASYLAEGGREAGTLTLNTVQVRPNSERVSLDGRLLSRETDYTIDYDLGRITFNRPDTLFPVPRQVSVRYEENPLFTAAPTSIFGFVSQFPLENGQLNFTAISQQQRSGFNRPPLGFEPVGSLVAGVSGNLAWDASLVSRALRALPFGERPTPSRLSLQGEFAMSKPQPNAAGQAYIESFEGDAGVPISMFESAWYFGSRPALGTRLPALLGGGPFSLNRASTLAYQNNGVDGVGNFVQFTIQQIDPAVRIVGGGVQPPETVLWMTLYPLRTGGIFDFEPGSNRRRFAWTVGDQTLAGPTPTGRRWRSLRTVLNPSGADLSRIETLEFFALVQAEPGKRQRNPTLVFDFGEISENSVTFAPETLYVDPPVRPGLPPDSTWRGKRFTGFNRFDSERDPFSRAFNAVGNDIGLPGDVADTIVVVDRATGAPPRIVERLTLCSAAIQVVQVLGDSRANCTVRNNRLDEEDIDLDGRLNLTDDAIDQEQFKRFVVDLGDETNWTRTGRCYRQQDSTAAGVVSDSLCWVQVRLNWRAPYEEVNAPNDRRLRAMRMTMVSSGALTDDDFSRIALTRFRLVGAPWLKRSDRPLSGAGGDSTAALDGYVIASIVGTLDSTAALPYSPPPGVVEAPENRQSGFENNRIQINENALRLQAGVPGRPFRTFDRAEAFFRFPEGTKTFMGYRTLRVWMRGRGHGWGQAGELNGYIKVGRDEHNFYLYRTPVNTGPMQNAWDPEIRVDLSRFQTLRAQLENNFLTGSADSLACAGTDLELVRRSGLPRGQVARRFAVCQDGYIVYSADPAITPPNLAGVQELAVGFVRIDSVPRGGDAILPNDTLELWINDIRLTDVVDDIGFAGELGITMNAADLADFRVGLSRRDPNFRQLGETPSFLTSSGVNLGTTLHLEKMLPVRFGVVMPFAIDYSGTGVDQLFINKSDVRAAGIDGLRNPRDARVNYAFGIRRATPLTRGWYAPVVNGLSLNGTWGTGRSQSAFQETTSSSYVIGGVLSLGGDDRTSRLPRPLDWLLARLPARLRDSEAIRSFRGQRLRWAPTQVRLTSSLARTGTSATSFTKAAASPSDTGQVVTGLNHAWQNQGTLEFRPLLGLTLRSDARQMLDLRDYRDLPTVADSTDRRAATRAERLRLLGADVGLERERSLSNAVFFQPTLATWFRPRVDFTSQFTLFKDPNARALLRTGDSTGAFRLPKRLGATQTFSTGTTFEPGRFLLSRFGDSSVVRRFARALQPIDVNWTRNLSSGYDNTAFLPGLGYQFGLGGIDDFRGLGTRLSTSASRNARFSTAGSVNLPLAFNLGVRFEDGLSETWTRRSLDGFQALITSDQRVYPDVTLRWSYRPLRLRRLLSSVSLNARYLLTEGNTVVPNETGGFADQSRTSSRSTPISGSIVWAVLGTLSTNASYDHTVREEARPGSLTIGDTRRASLDVARQFKLPRTWNTRGNLRTRLSYQSEETVSTVGDARGPEEVVEAVLPPSVLTNNGRRAFNFNADTDLSDALNFSMTGSHILTYDRNFNRRVSTVVFSAVLSLRFFAGELR
jgi:cell surface protein SprA